MPNLSYVYPLFFVVAIPMDFFPSSQMFHSRKKNISYVLKSITFSRQLTLEMDSELGLELQVIDVLLAEGSGGGTASEPGRANNVGGGGDACLLDRDDTCWSVVCGGTKTFRIRFPVVWTGNNEELDVFVENEPVVLTASGERWFILSIRPWSSLWRICSVTTCVLRVFASIWARRSNNFISSSFSRMRTSKLRTRSWSFSLSSRLLEKIKLYTLSKLNLAYPLLTDPCLIGVDVCFDRSTKGEPYPFALV